MDLLTYAHQRFLLKSLPTEKEPYKEINLQGFYIKFGFLKRETAESAFQRALSKIYSLDTVTDDQKAYIKEPYYETESIEAFKTLELNEYWKSVEGTEREEVVVKKRQEAFSNNLIIPVRSPKERRIAVNTTRNKIMDLSNSGPSGQSTVALASLKKEAKTVKVPLPLIPSAVEDSINKNFTKNISLEIKFDNLTKKMQMESEYEATVCFKLLTHFVETHILNPDVFIISKLKQFSEMDMNLFFWGRVFVLLFPGSGDLKIRFGEVKLESSTFKIDHKVGCFVKEKFVTISCIEVGKFVEPDKELVFEVNDHEDYTQLGGSSEHLVQSRSLLPELSNIYIEILDIGRNQYSKVMKYYFRNGMCNSSLLETNSRMPDK
ncbi:hypothetical protein HPULCUR_011476 [Helicostylum pulchrum]|uniref:Uncharacterized protein n=1 Tax=Helicostylum pulchrum TaxID=562976 RepID=A0ABP9YG63_9FUNG